MALRPAGIYGGPFDPVHNGHIEVAGRILELFELDEVIFVPACVPPHKRGAGITSAFHRFAMLALATQHDARLRLSTIELEAPDRPYAVDTVERRHSAIGCQQRRRSRAGLFRVFFKPAIPAAETARFCPPRLRPGGAPATLDN